MIGRIQGQLLETTDNFVLIDVGGVAYEIEVTTTALEQLPGNGEEVRLFTHFVVREDAQLLYGFASRIERDVFRDLIRISGVGPKLGLSLISGISLEQLAQAVQSKDTGMLTRVPGVGKKTAERLLIELEDRMSNIVLQPVLASEVQQSAVEDAESALVALGYKAHEARRAIGGACERAAADADTTELVRLALQQLARQAEISR